MTTNGCVEVLNPDTKKQLGIKTDLTEIAMTIVVVASTKHSGPLSLYTVATQPGLKLKIQERSGLERCFVSAITHMSCKVGRGRMNYRS